MLHLLQVAPVMHAILRRPPALGLGHTRLVVLLAVLVIVVVVVLVSRNNQR